MLGETLTEGRLGLQSASLPANFWRMDEAATAQIGDGGQGGDFSLLADPHRIQSDCAMARRAIREGWPVKRREMVVERLEEIVEKRTLTIATATGIVEVEGPADSNAIAAARVLVAMDGLNQADDHLQDKNQRLDAGQATEAIAVVRRP